MNGFSQNLTSFAKQISLGFKELKHLSLSRLRKVFSLMGKNEKIAVSVLLALAAISLFVSLRNIYNAHTVPAPDFGGSYTEGLMGQPTYINPLLANQEPDLSLTNLVFSGLYKYGSGGRLIPDLADGMPAISQDQKQYTINLKRGLKWQNGKPLTADDIIFTIGLLQDSNYKSPLWPLWQSTTVAKLSDYSVKFTTKDISGPFINNLTLPILPKSVWSGVDAQNFLLSKYNLEALGSGPYTIKQVKKLPSGKVEEISLESNPNYSGGKPKIDRLIFKFYDNEDDILNAFHSREIDGFGYVPLGSDIYLDKNQPQAQILTVPLPQYQIIFFNLNNKILNDINVRTALSLATDKQQIINRVFAGNAFLPVSPWLGQGQAAATSTADLNQARSLLDNGGWKINPATGIRANKQGQALAFTISTNDTLVNSKAAETLADQWKALNITVNLNILPSKQLTDTLIKPRTFDVLLFPQKFGADPDPFPFWHSSQTKDPGFNLTGFSDPNADKLIIDARTTTDQNVQAQDYRQFNDLIMSKIPIIFLDQTEYIYAVDNSVKNVSLNVLYDPSLRFNGISQWYMAEKRVWK
jgi:peptide/nickel transport system substrate-binding protein